MYEDQVNTSGLCITQNVRSTDEQTISHFNLTHSPKYKKFATTLHFSNAKYFPNAVFLFIINYMVLFYQLLHFVIKKYTTLGYWQYTIYSFPKINNIFLQ